MSSSTEPALTPVRLVLVRKSVPVILVDPETSEEKEYKIVEMVGPEKAVWQNSMAKRMRFDANGVALGMREFAGLEASLIGKCLVGPDGNHVPEKTIDGWPVSVQKDLFLMAFDLNALDKKREDDEKNS